MGMCGVCVGVWVWVWCGVVCVGCVWVCGVEVEGVVVLVVVDTLADEDVDQMQIQAWMVLSMMINVGCGLGWRCS